MQSAEAILLYEHQKDTQFIVICITDARMSLCITCMYEYITRTKHTKANTQTHTHTTLVTFLLAWVVSRCCREQIERWTCDTQHAYNAAETYVEPVINNKGWWHACVICEKKTNSYNIVYRLSMCSVHCSIYTYVSNSLCVHNWMEAKGKWYSRRNKKMHIADDGRHNVILLFCSVPM